VMASGERRCSATITVAVRKSASFDLPPRKGQVNLGVKTGRKRDSTGCAAVKDQRAGGPETGGAEQQGAFVGRLRQRT
jgi:hypothetical protein